MSNNKQSSVEWLENEFASLYFDYLTGLIDNKEYNERHKVIIEQAKAMHKEEHENTWIDSRIEDKGDDHIGKQKSFDEYYNETFNNDAKK